MVWPLAWRAWSGSISDGWETDCYWRTRDIGCCNFAFRLASEATLKPTHGIYRQWSFEVCPHQGVFQCSVHYCYLRFGCYVSWCPLHFAVVQSCALRFKFGRFSFKACWSPSLKERLESSRRGDLGCIQRKHEVHRTGKDATINMGGGRGENGRRDFPIY